MSLRSSVGVAIGTDPYAVAANACQDALDHLGTKEADLFIVFSSVKFDQEKMLAGIHSVGGDTQVVGCSTAGEIGSNGPVRDHSVAVMSIKSDTVKFYAGIGEGIAKNPRKAGTKAAEEVKKQAGNSLKSFVMFPDVLVGNGAEIVRGVLDILGPHFPVVGGAAGDDFKFEKTYQYFNKQVYSGAVVGLGIAGEIKIGLGVSHGWIPIGIPKKVTRSSGSVLHELDGQPAISIYEEYFGKEVAKQMRSEVLAKLAITYPLGIRADNNDEMLIRDPFTVDEKGSITCAAEIPEGSLVQLMIGSREEAISVARSAARKAMSQLDGAEPKAVIVFNCIARSKLFGEQAPDEIAAIQNVIGGHVPLIGFYTYGEQAPVGGEVKNISKCNPAFHNETVVICILAE